MRTVGAYLAAVVLLTIILIPVNSRAGFRGLHWWIPVSVGFGLAILVLVVAAVKTRRSRQPPP